jgi:iron complex outermembrane receptor protein
MSVTMTNDLGRSSALGFGSRCYRFARALALVCIGTGTLGYAAVVSAADNSAAATPDETSSVALQEITVTATRRAETLQQVPYNISSIGAGALGNAGVTSINGLTQLVPGLETMDTGPTARGGNNQLSMRGLRTDSPGGETDFMRTFTVASVSTYLGETPLFFPLALKDLERVEVLKGPQGTLYGSGALAGTIRFIPKRPEFDRFSGAFDMQGSGTQYSGKLSGSFDGFVNVPLTDNLAVRVSGGYERLGGYIDQADLIQRSVPGDATSAPVLRVPSDPRSGYALAPILHDTNTSERWYVRPVVRWKASDALDAEFSFTHQYVKSDDSPTQNASYAGGTYNFDSVSGDPNAINTYRPGGAYTATADRLSPSSNKLDLAALVVTANLGGVSLTSSSSAYRAVSRESAYYVNSSQVFNADGTLALNYYDFFNNYPRANLQDTNRTRDESFVQEVRLVSTWDKPIDYIIGAYYQSEKLNYENISLDPGYTTYANAVGAPGLPRPHGDLQYLYPMDANGFRFTDRAIFGELTWHPTKQWQLTGGLRLFRQDFRTLGEAIDYFYDGAGTTDLSVDNRVRVNDHIIKFNSSYDFSPDLKVYATYSEGFRRGGANQIPTGGVFASVPALLTFAPDKSKNYEVGVKGLMFEGAMRYTFDVFLIKLEKFQFNSYSGSAFPAVFNGSEAKSKGAELEMQYQLSERLLLGFSYAYTDAKVSNGFTIYDYAASAAPTLIPVASIASGTRLPITPKSSANISANYAVPFNSAKLQLHADMAYRERAPGYIDPTSPRYWEIPSTFVLNTRLTYDPGQNWTADMFVNNVTNETVLSGAFGTLQSRPNLFQERYVGRPRTYGLGLHYKW